MNIRKPNQATIRRFLDCQRSSDLSYPFVGGTKSKPPAGFDVDCNRVLLGHGEAVFHAACDALQRWQMFPQGWTQIVPSDAEQHEGVTLAMLAHCFGLWWLNACRVVYTFDETSPHRRFGFAYGTLPGHVECGEERFMIEQDDDGYVWYEIYSFSRPRFWLARLFYPLARRLQRKFVRQSLSQMREIVTATRSDVQEEALVT